MNDSGDGVFIGHHEADAGAVTAFAQGLRTLGVTVRSSPDPSCALHDAKLVVIWLSKTHADDAGLQRRFMQAYSASLHHPPRARLLIVDALHSPEAALPSVLRTACQVIPAHRLMECVEQIARHVRQLEGPLCTTPLTECGSRELILRTGLLWQVHESLCGEESSGRRAAQLIGEAGAGKSSLARDYVEAFGSAYAGGVFRADTGWFDHPTQTQWQQMRLHTLREIARTLGSDSDTADEQEVTSELRRRLEAHKAPYLWIVDHIPPGQSEDSVRAWLAPSPNGITLLISRTAEYESLATPITVGAFGRDEACALFARHKPLATEQEVNAAQQLFEQLGGHALAIHLAAIRLARSTYDRMLLQLAAPSREAAQVADGLASTLQHSQLVGIAVSIQRTIARLSAQGRQALRLASVLANAPVPIALLTTALAQQVRGSSAAHRSVSQTQFAFDELVGFKLAERTADAVSITPLVREAVLGGDAAQDLDSARQLLIAILSGELTQTTDATRDNPYWSWLPHVLHLVRTSSASPALLELSAWLARFDATLGVLRADDRRAVALLEQGAIAQAEELLDRELAARRIGLGEQHLQTVTPANNLGVALSLRGEFARARSLFEQAIEVRRQALGDGHRDLLTPLNNLGVVLWHEGEHVKARKVFEKVVELRRQLLGDRHPDTLVSMRNLAVALRRDGEFVAARSLLEHVVEVRRASLGTQHVDTCTAMASLAETLRAHSEAILSRISETLTLDPPLLGHDGVRIARA